MMFQQQARWIFTRSTSHGVGAFSAVHQRTVYSAGCASSQTLDGMSTRYHNKHRKRYSFVLPTNRIANQDRTQMMLSSYTKPRETNSRYSVDRHASDNATYEAYPNQHSYQFQYRYPLSCGSKLSAISYDSNSWDNIDDSENEVHHQDSQPQQRPYPPPLIDQTANDDGFGAYDYDISLDVYDQAEQEKQQQLFTADPNQNKIKDNDVIRKTRLSSVSTSTKKTLRPPVQISIPSLSSYTTSNVITNFDPSISFDEETPSNVDDDKASIGTIATDIEDVRVTSTRSTESLIPSTHFHPGQTLTSLPDYDPALDEFLSKAAYGVGTTTTLDVLREELQTLEQSIYQHNNQCQFNINSSKQVAAVLFGADQGSCSTNKDVLEGMAGGGNRLAELILQYRSTKYKLTKFTSQQKSRSKGTAVRSALTVARPAGGEIVPQLNELNAPINVSDGYSNTVTDKSEQATEKMRDMLADPLLLLDASAYIYRAYYSMPPIHRPDGMPIGAVMGFCKMLNALLLNRMLDGQQPRLVLCFDAKGKTFRHDLYSDYKGNRAPPPMDLVPQFDLVRQAAKAYGICQIEAMQFEADDVIATLACKAIAEGVDTNILSGDKDLMQLVTDLNVSPSIQMIDPMKKERTTYTQVLEKWEVPPDKLGDVLALAGDAVDNVPGVRGIGPKTAAKLINEFGSLDNLLNNIGEVKQRGVREKLYEDEAKARLSRTLVELNRNVPMVELLGLPDGIHQRMSALRMETIDPDRIIAFYDQMGFKELKRTFQNSLNGLKLKKKASAYSKRSKATIPTPDDYKDVPF
jgi:5'-3' exonuclease